MLFDRPHFQRIAPHRRPAKDKAPLLIDPGGDPLFDQPQFQPINREAGHFDHTADIGGALVGRRRSGLLYPWLAGVTLVHRDIEGGGANGGGHLVLLLPRVDRQGHHIGERGLHRVFQRTPNFRRVGHDIMKGHTGTDLQILAAQRAHQEIKGRSAAAVAIGKGSAPLDCAHGGDGGPPRGFIGQGRLTLAAPFGVEFALVQILLIQHRIPRQGDQTFGKQPVFIHGVGTPGRHHVEAIETQGGAAQLHLIIGDSGPWFTGAHFLPLMLAQGSIFTHIVEKKVQGAALAPPVAVGWKESDIHLPSLDAGQFLVEQFTDGAVKVVDHEQAILDFGF